MGKRKRKDSDVDAVCRKIRRLEKKLRHSKRYKRRDHRSDYSSSDVTPDRYDNSEPDNRQDSDYYEDSDDQGSYPSSVVTVPVRTVPDPAPDRATDQIPDPDQATQSTPDPAPDTLTVVANNQTEPNPTPSSLPSEILEVLGEAKKVGDVFGEKIPAEISERWGKILLDGLAKEQKDSLLGKMAIPENFTLSRAPLLNLEVNAVLTDTAKNRDKRLEKAQNQLGSGIVGLANLTKDLIQSEMNKIDIIKRLSEVSQILLDLHYEETMNRRRLIIPLLDKHFWNTIKGVKRDNHLFGDKLGENIRHSKEIQKSSSQIRKPAPPRANIPKPHNSGNSRAPPRQQNTQKSAVPSPASAPAHYNSARRNNNTTTTSTRARYNNPPPPSSSKFNDRRHR